VINFQRAVVSKKGEKGEKGGNEANPMNEFSDFLSPRARSVLLGDRQCTARNRGGERCGRSSAIGQTVCDRHGAKAPLSIAAARERLMMLVEPAIGALMNALRSGPPCEHCGRSDSDRDPVTVNAARLVLDRCGYGPSQTITLQPPEDRYASSTTDELIARLEALLARAHALKDFEEARELNTLDGHVIEPEPARADPEGDCTIADNTREKPKENEETAGNVSPEEPDHERP
jgi:hypothetical protein